MYSRRVKCVKNKVGSKKQEILENNYLRNIQDMGISCAKSGLVLGIT